MVEAVSGGDGAFIKKMIALFIETVPQNVEALKQSLQSGNWEQVAKMAHKLKSTVDSMGIVSIKQLSVPSKPVRKSRKPGRDPGSCS